MSGIRISDTDRDSAAARLQEALAEGRITLSELEERLVAVYAARYASDLRAPFADLPDLAPAGATPPLLLRTGMGALRRQGTWAVPSHIRVQSAMGAVLLDFCDSTLPPVVDVTLELGAGSARLLVPKGASADVDGMASAMGAIRSTIAATPAAGRPHFVVHGRSLMGSVTVRQRPWFASRRR